MPPEFDQQPLGISNAARVHLAYSQRGDDRGKLIARVAQHSLMGASETMERALSELAVAITSITASNDDEDVLAAEEVVLLEWRQISPTTPPPSSAPR